MINLDDWDSDGAISSISKEINRNAQQGQASPFPAYPDQFSTATKSVKAEPLKEELNQAHEQYQQLKEAAEKLTSGDPKSGMRADEFERHVAGLWDKLHRHAEHFIAACNATLGDDA